MTLNAHELFLTLMEQINIEQNEQTEKLFESGQVESVTVLKNENIWEIHLFFPEILSVDLYMLLEGRLKKSFENIADIDLHINTDNSEFNEEQLASYWKKACSDSGIDSPLCNQLFENSLPVLDGKKVIFYIEHDITVKKFSSDFFPEIEKQYKKMGFPQQFKITPVVDKETSEKRIQEFKESKEKQDEELAQKLTEHFEQNSKEREKQQKERPSGPIKMGRGISANEEIRQMADINEEERKVIVEGYVFDVEVRELRSNRKLLLVKMTDYSSSFLIKKFSNNADDENLFAQFKEGMWLKVSGSVQEDRFVKDLVLIARDIQETFHEKRKDTAAEDEKRVELHAHTTMSQMDATITASDVINQAADFGHKAVAITDHGVVQSYPEAHSTASDRGIKMLYGLEANLVDDGVPIAYNPSDINLNEATYVVFDVETTGLSAIYDKIIELAAVKMYKGNVIKEFQEFIDPGHPLSETTVNLTGITDDMVKGSKSEEQVLNEFKSFTEETILVAHNASFDMGFLNTAYRRYELTDAGLPVIDTLELSRMLHPKFKSHRLNTLAKKYGVNLEQHHRAIFDSETTAHLLWEFLKEANADHGIDNHNQLNSKMGEGDSYKRARPMHATILVKTQKGLKNLFKLVSASLVDYFYRVPRIPKSILNQYSEGLIIGSGCDQGEVFEAMMQKGEDEARKRAQSYDYIEVMPKGVYQPLIDRELVKNESDLEDIIRNLVKLGKELDKPVVATGNVHYLNEEDKIFRDIILESLNKGRKRNVRNPEVHFRTTDEMLEEFSFLGEETARELVVENSQKIADSIDDEISPIKSDLYTPKMDGSEEEIRSMTFNKAKELYGDPLPEIVEKRLEKELDSIIGNGFSVIYLISQKLVDKSVNDGYLVGSRGSVGSSLVATMTGITEVNPLSPHYRCPNCQYSEFFTNGEIGSGYDLEEKACPNCGETLTSDGHDIPFETFLGFNGDKVPDIDLNFSGEYQAKAHDYTKVLFGEDHVFRAGTISTIADKTAFGYVKGYEGDNQLEYRSAEIDRLSKGVAGVKRTTGQHPGGIIVIPDDMDVYDFTPIQYPADDQNSEWNTTHFDFHSIEDNVLKLDILGHDDPTMIRKLQDLSGIDPKTIPVDDPEVMKIFSGPEVLGVTEEQIFSKSGTLGVPEFGTQFVRSMLEKTKPTTFSELLQISGLSHGTDVWLGNAEELIEKHGLPLSDVIGCRDDIMVDLQQKGLDDSLAFKIMEYVRKGRGIPDEWQAEMRAHDVPEWYITSCLKIKYMFPKAHAAAYILMALRVAYFKVHYPLYYYASYFSVRASDFDLVAMAKGKDAVKARIKEIQQKGMEATATDKSLLTVLELANEMLERGYDFKMVDIDKSDSTDFIIEGNSLIAPFRAVPSLGGNVANAIVEARQDKEFLSKEDLSKRGKVSKTVLEYLDTNNVLNHLPDENQLSLFDI